MALTGAGSTGQGQTSPYNPNYVPPIPLEDLDPGLIDMIGLHAVRMGEVMAIAIDGSKSEEERLDAFEGMELQLLSEALTDSNGVTIHVELEPLSLSALTIVSALDIDMEVLKLWEPIIHLTTSPIPAIAAQALWVMVNILEQKPESQSTFLKHEPFPTIIIALSSEKSADDVRENALYLLSATLQRNGEAVVRFTEAKGWKALKAALEDPHIIVRQKTASLLYELLLPPSPPPSTETSDMIRSAIETHRILSSLTSSLVNPRPFGLNADQTLSIRYYEVTAVKVVVTYLQGLKWSQTVLGRG